MGTLLIDLYREWESGKHSTDEIGHIDRRWFVDAHKSFL